MATPITPESLLPQSVGIAVDTQAPITISFETPMNPASVESAFELLPAQPVRLAWNEAHTALTVAPHGRWRTDERYLVVVGSESATSLGSKLRTAQRFAFTTLTAPAVTDFQVHLAGADLAAAKAAAAVKEVSIRSTVMAADTGARAQADAIDRPIGEGATSQSPTDTPDKVSSDTSISIDFSVPMDRNDVEERFAISPEIDGSLRWKSGSIVFTPSERLHPGTRYTISVIGAHDLDGNALGGESNFSFIVQSSAQLTKTEPRLNATDAEPASISMWFSHRMHRSATNKALRVTDTATGALVAGKITWNEKSTQLTVTPDQPLAAGHAFEVSLSKGARDAEGNPVKASWSFTTKASLIAAAASRTTVSTRTVIGAPGGSRDESGGLCAEPGERRTRCVWPRSAGARREHLGGRRVPRHGPGGQRLLQPLRPRRQHARDAPSARRRELRMVGREPVLSGRPMSQEATLNWCHAQFMAEPYPGQFNHIANILNPNAPTHGRRHRPGRRQDRHRLGLRGLSR